MKVIAPLILNLCTRLKWVVSHMICPGHFTAGGKNPQQPLNRRPGGPLSLSQCFWREKYLSLSGIQNLNFPAHSLVWQFEHGRIRRSISRHRWNMVDRKKKTCPTSIARDTELSISYSTLNVNGTSTFASISSCVTSPYFSTNNGGYIWPSSSRPRTFTLKGHSNLFKPLNKQLS